MANNVDLALILTNVAYIVLYTVVILAAITWTEYLRHYAAKSNTRWYNRLVSHILPATLACSVLILVLDAVRLYSHMDTIALVAALVIAIGRSLLYAGSMYVAGRCLALLYAHLWARHVYLKRRQAFDTGVRLTALFLAICVLSLVALAYNALLVQPLLFLAS